MFKCGFCGRQVGKGVKRTMIVTETREKIYSTKRIENNQEIDVKSKGVETVKELAACPECVVMRGGLK